MKRYISGIGQDSHRFLQEDHPKKCVVGGVVFDEVPGLYADSDGDVVLHAICNAITSITHIPILGQIAIDMCHKQGITDSACYLAKALETLTGYTIEHVALTVEGQRPKFQKKAEVIRQKVSSLLNINISQVGITFTSGDGLSDFGRGEGLMCFCLITVSSKMNT